MPENPTTQNYDFHGGSYEEIEKHCQRIQSPTEKVRYLEWALAELEKLILDNRDEATRIPRAIYSDLPHGDDSVYDRAVHLIPKRKLTSDLRYWTAQKTQETTGVRKDGEEFPLHGDEPVSQEFWSDGLKDFKGIMHQLSIAPNLFVSKDTYKDAELIFKGHFDNPKLETDPNHMIDWIGKGAAYRVFYDLLVKTERIGQQPYSHFFKAHFLRSGKPCQDTHKINDWAADKRKNRDEPSEDEQKLKKIVS